MAGRVPIHFGMDERVLFGWYHAPDSAENRGVGVILCNTLGNESLRLPRALRHAAEKLARAGFAVLRFDFYATGDSAGEDTDVNEIDGWIGDIRIAIDELKRRSGVNKISLLGVRFGATLAAQVAADLGAVEDLVLWEPCISGKDFIKETSRQHKILVSLSPSGFTFDQTEGAPKGKEFLGFFINDATLSGFEKQDLMALTQAPAKNVLIIAAASAPGPLQKLIDHFTQIGSKTDYEQAIGFQGIFREALLSEVPSQVLDRLTEWFLQKHPELTRGEPSPPPPSPSPHLSPHLSQHQQPSKSFHESPFFFGEKEQLFGILTTPKAPTSTAVIIVNAGVGTRIGPHRLYVQMAREWAKLGFSVFRVDLSGSGDSPAETPEEESSPYPRLSVSDVSDAMTYLQSKHSIKRFVVAGVCSGADIAFRSAVHDPRVSGSIIINPRSFCTYNFPELELHIRAHHLESTLKRGKNWMSLLKSGVGAIGRIAQVSKSILFRMKQTVLKSFKTNDGAGFPVKDIPEGFHKILDRGSHVFLAVSDGDPGTEYIDIHFPEEMRALEQTPRFHRVRLKGTDHLFTLKYAREAVLRKITEYLVGLHLN
jgi:dienelactone hydrolase